MCVYAERAIKRYFIVYLGGRCSWPFGQQMMSDGRKKIAHFREKCKNRLHKRDEYHCDAVPMLLDDTGQRGTFYRHVG